MDWLESSGSQILALLTVDAGTILLFTFAIPPDFDRYSTILFVPLPFLEISHLLGVAAGIALLMIAWDISLTLEAAYKKALLLLCCGIGTSMLRGFNTPVVACLTLIALTLGYCGSSLRCKPCRTGGGQYPYEWLLLGFVLLATAIWIGLFAHKGTPYSSELWITFAYSAEFSRFLRGALMMWTTWVGFLIYRRITVDKVMNRKSSEPSCENLGNASGEYQKSRNLYQPTLKIPWDR